MRQPNLLTLLLLAAQGLVTSLTALPQADAAAASSEPLATELHPRFTLVEEFTASTLGRHEFKIGTDLDGGVTDRWMVGTDMTALVVGVATFQTKFLIASQGSHLWAFGLKLAALDRDTLLWGSAREHFISLSARVIRPSVSWTQQLSPRLKLHTFWAKGLGRVQVQLSEKGRRKLWETKHSGSDYDSRDKRTQEPRPKPTTTPASPESTSEKAEGDGDTSAPKENQEKVASETSSLTSQSLQVQSVSGLSQERFQLTGEFTRANGNKVLVTTRIERNDIEELRSNFFRLTVAHQWIWPQFQSRLGVGLQYFVLTGRDLDDELIDTAGVQPASDISFYWRL